MKKTLILGLLVSLLGFSAFAEGEELNFGLGFVTGISDQVNLADNTRITGFASWGFELIPSLYLGIEGLFTAQQVSEESEQVTILEQLWDDYYLLIDDTYTTEFSNWDLSPRFYAKAKISEAMGLTGFMGYNYNYLVISTTDSDGELVDNPEGDNPEWKPGPVPNQAVAGLRFNYSWFYAEFTRFFDLEDDGDADWSAISNNRISLGVYLNF